MSFSDTFTGTHPGPRGRSFLCYRPLDAPDLTEKVCFPPPTSHTPRNSAPHFFCFIKTLTGCHGTHTQRFLENYARYEKQLCNASDGNTRALVAAVTERGSAENPQALTTAVVCAIMLLPPPVPTGTAAGAARPDGTDTYRETLFAMLPMAVPDSTTVLGGVLKQLCDDLLTRLQPGAREQVLWMYSELLRKHAAEAESLTAHILRGAATGNHSEQNVSLVRTLVSILSDNMFATPSTTFSFLFAFMVRHTRACGQKRSAVETWTGRPGVLLHQQPGPGPPEAPVFSAESRGDCTLPTALGEKSLHTKPPPP